MAPRITSSTDRRGRVRSGGFTLVELMVGTSLGAIVLTAMALLFSYTNRSFATLANYTTLNQKSLIALDYLTTDVRQAYSLVSYATNQLVFNMGPGSSNLTYTYNPSAKTLTRSQAGLSKTILTDCDQLTFSIFQRTPIEGTYDQYPPATVANCKVVQVDWSCSLRSIGSPVNSQTAQTAKIVLRK